MLFSRVFFNDSLTSPSIESKSVRPFAKLVIACGDFGNIYSRMNNLFVGGDAIRRKFKYELIVMCAIRMNVVGYMKHENLLVRSFCEKKNSCRFRLWNGFAGAWIHAFACLFAHRSSIVERRVWAYASVTVYGKCLSSEIEIACFTSLTRVPHVPKSWVRKILCCYYYLLCILL